MLKIRDSATVRPLDIPEEKLKYLKDILNAKRIAPVSKRNIQKAISGMCCICGEIPTQLVSYPLEDFGIKIERYCDICFHGFYEHEKVL